MVGESKFNDFKQKVDYHIENVIDTNTYEKKKIYSEAPFVITPQPKFNIKIGALLPKFTCFIRKRGEQFGDAVAYDLTNATVRLFVYDKDNNLVVRDSMTKSNLSLGEVSYFWKKFDLQFIGFYTALVEITEQNGDVLILPASQPRLEIIVS